MEGKFCQYMILMMLLLGQLYGYNSCVEKERKALLELKKYIISITIEVDSDYVLPTWTNDTKSDCCYWEGLKCNRTSKRVTEIAFGTLYLQKNSLLNLSLLHPFEDVRCLNLSRYEYPQLNGLFDDVEGYKSLGRLRNLEILDLSSNKFNNSIFPFLSVATSLTTLFLRSNKMDGPFPTEELKDLKNLKLLDLSENNFNGAIPTRELSALSKLKALDLSDNGFSGSMELQGICEMKNMQELDLSKNKLVGQFPACLTGLTGLRVLDLSSNKLTGKVPSALSNLESLEYLSLYDNNFEGLFSLGFLANLSELRVFTLDSRSKSLQVESKSSWKPKFQLSVIALPSCNLVKIPHFLLYQKNLRCVDLSDNKITRTFPSWLLENNTKFGSLLELHSLNLSHNYLSGVIPGSFSGMKNMESLDLSFNRLQGQIPPQLSELSSLVVFNVSYNNLSGVIPQGRQFNTFDTRSYLSNPLLRGQPTNISCNGNNSRGPDYDGVKDDESQIDMVSFYWSFAAAYVTILVGLFSSLSFDSPWSRFWFYLVDVFIHKARNLLW